MGRDILLAGLCIPFTLDSEVIHMTWNLGLEYCISFRYFYYCFLFFLPLIWFFSALFAVPTAFFTELNDIEMDPYKNDVLWGRPNDAKVCMHSLSEWGKTPSLYFFFASFVLIFLLPVILLIIPWFALLIQAAGCCTRRLRSSDFWLSLITLFLILIFEASRAPFELFNIHYVLTNWSS